MGALLELVLEAPADSSLAFREKVYRRGDQGELLRDLIALANAAVVGRRFLILGVVDRPRGTRKFPGISQRSWRSFCAVAQDFLARTVEPALRISFETVEVGTALVGAVCLDSCEDPPYLLAQRVGAALPAGCGWRRHGTRIRRLMRKDFESIFSARMRRDGVGDVRVGFPGELPREELELEVLPLDDLPSRRAAGRVERMIEARRVSRAVLGRTDTRIVRLVHTQVEGSAVPYQERGTSTLRVLLENIPEEHAAADDHYRFEQRAHRVNFMLQNLADRPQTDLVLTLKIPRIDGVDVAERLYPAVSDFVSRQDMYPKVDIGPRTITVQATHIRIPRQGCIGAFAEPLRLLLREPAAGRILRIAYTLQGSTLERPVQGRLKIFVR
jgi:hypothetical protein